jgi:hypothetical protein
MRPRDLSFGFLRLRPCLRPERPSSGHQGNEHERAETANHQQLRRDVRKGLLLHLRHGRCHRSVGLPSRKQILFNALESAIKPPPEWRPFEWTIGRGKRTKSALAVLLCTREHALGSPTSPSFCVWPGEVRHRLTGLRRSSDSDNPRDILRLISRTRQSPNEMPVARAVRTVSWFGSTRFGSPRT